MTASSAPAPNVEAAHDASFQKNHENTGCTLSRKPFAIRPKSGILRVRFGKFAHASGAKNSARNFNAEPRAITSIPSLGMETPAHRWFSHQHPIAFPSHRPRMQGHAPISVSKFSVFRNIDDVQQSMPAS
jgi:hypothetical protein